MKPSLLLASALGLEALAFVSSAAEPPAAPAPALRLLERQAELGEPYQFATVEREFPFVNASDRAVRVARTIDPGGTAELAVEPMLVPPGGHGLFRVRQNLGDRLGLGSWRYSFETDEPGTPRYRVALTGFVQSAYDPERPAVELGVVEAGREAEARLELASREVPRLELLGQDPDPDLTVTVAGRTGETGEALRLRVALSPRAPVGRVQRRVILRTNVPSQPQVAVWVTADVQGEITVTPNPVLFGLLESGAVADRSVRLVSRSGRGFTPRAVHRADGRELPFEAADCSPDGSARSCWQLALRLAAEPVSTLRQLDEIVRVGLDDGSSVPVALRAWLVPAGVPREQIVIGAPEEEPLFPLPPEKE